MSNYEPLPPAITQPVSYARRMLHLRGAVIERACEKALIAGHGVTVNDDEGWARPDPEVPYGQMVVWGYPRSGAWDPTGGEWREHADPDLIDAEGAT